MPLVPSQIAVADLTHLYTHRAHFSELPSLIKHTQLDVLKPRQLDRRGEAAWAGAHDRDA